MNRWPALFVTLFCTATFLLGFSTESAAWKSSTVTMSIWKVNTGSEATEARVEMKGGRLSFFPVQKEYLRPIGIAASGMYIPPCPCPPGGFPGPGWDAHLLAPNPSTSKVLKTHYGPGPDGPVPAGVKHWFSLKAQVALRAIR